MEIAVMMTSKQTMMRMLLISLIISSGILKIQAQGIHFDTGESWEQILAKAKSENKYIFVDCYATWCVPCKVMEQTVYPLKEIGDIYNKDFISVKVQIDKTSTDNDTVKSWYGTAEMLSKDYTVDEFPTFLFFDANGNPVHKAIGSLREENFTKLAAVAQDPGKQYYRVLKNFRPGKLDTGELKGLVNMFDNCNNNEMAGKIAADYLSRIPRSQLGNLDNENLIFYHRSNPDVLNIAILWNNHNRAESVYLMLALKDQPRIQQIARDYIRHLTEEQLYTTTNIIYLANFTDNTTDRGFSVFYDHAPRVDAIMKHKGYAHDQVENVIANTEYNSFLRSAKKTGMPPDFNQISATITNKYNKGFAEEIIVRGKVKWYEYLVNDKKEDQYRPDLIASYVELVNRFKIDTVDEASGFINNVCYGLIFKYSKDQFQLNSACKWMADLVARNPKDYNMIDTYASLLYKSGDKTEAMEWADKLLQMAIANNSKGDIQYQLDKLTSMQRGEQIWIEKEFQ